MGIKKVLKIIGIIIIGGIALRLFVIAILATVGILSTLISVAIGLFVLYLIGCLVLKIIKKA